MFALNDDIRLTDPEDRSWWAEARCNDGAATMSGLYFSEELQDIARAKAICAKCTERIACLAGAVERGEPWGVWGGELLDTGHIVTVKRPRGRPPKNARPILVIDEDKNLTALDDLDVVGTVRVA